MKNLIKGNTIIFEGKLGEKIEGYKIRLQLWDEKGINIKKATLNAGGSDEQIKITDINSGIILIRIEKGETVDIENSAKLEIQMETNDNPTEKYTICQQVLNFSNSKINWETPE